MTDFSHEAVAVAALQKRVADLEHLVRCHGVGHLKTIAQKQQAAGQEVRKVLQGAGASLEEQLLASIAVQLVAAEIREATDVLEAGACKCGEEERVSLLIADAGAQAERPKPMRKLALVRKPSTDGGAA